MHRLSFIALVLLVACTTPEPVAPVTFRAPGAPIYSSAVLEGARLDGHWVQVATFAPGGQAACAPGAVDITAGLVRWDLCLANGRRQGSGPMTPGKAGRFSVGGLGEWWVLWVDGDYRTMVVGSPSGEFGFVLDRGDALPADRLVAVRDILRFNGYGLESMVVF